MLTPMAVVRSSGASALLHVNIQKLTFNALSTNFQLYLQIFLSLFHKLLILNAKYYKIMVSLERY